MLKLENHSCKKNSVVSVSFPGLLTPSPLPLSFLAMGKIYSLNKYSLSAWCMAGDVPGTEDMMLKTTDKNRCHMKLTF